eukprot:scaffold15479_cov65-Cyclotella_meneghiniana.AAC.2
MAASAGVEIASVGAFNQPSQGHGDDVLAIFGRRLVRAYYFTRLLKDNSNPSASPDSRLLILGATKKFTENAG